MDAVSDSKLLKVAKYKVLSDHLFFTRYFFKKREGRKFVVGHHHEIIAEALDRVFRGECKRLIINVAPRYTKTELAVKNFMAKGLALNPSAKFIHLSYSDDLALDNSEAVRDMVQMEEFQELFDDVQIKPDSKAKKKWYLTKGGGVYATAAAGQVTGFGAGQVDEEEEETEEEILDEFLTGIQEAEQGLTGIEQAQRFGGALIIDDPIKPDDADSPTVRDRVNNRWDTTISNRVNSRNTPIVIIMQRLHENDLCGYLIERDGKKEDGGEWEVISLECLSFDAEGNKVALWPFKHTVEELEALRKKAPVVFDRQYQQKPMPLEGLLFPESELNFYDPEKVDVDSLVEYKHGFIDPADTGADSLSFPLGYLVQNKIYIPDLLYNGDGTDINEPACIEMIVGHRLNSCGIEGVSAWKLFGKAVRNKVAARYEDCEIRILKENRNKAVRINEASAFIKNHFVFRKDYKEHPQYYKFMLNMFSYLKEGGNQQHEDAPDGCCGLANYFRAQFPHLW